LIHKDSITFVVIDRFGNASLAAELGVCRAERQKSHRIGNIDAAYMHLFMP